MKRPHQITALILMLFSGLVAYQSLKLQYYTPLGPGPGFFPLWIAIFIGILALLMLAQSTLKKPEPLPHDFFDSRQSYLRALTICAAWIFATLSLNSLGYRLTMMIFFPFLLLTMGKVKWYITLAVTLLGSFGAYWCLVRLLRVPLPEGPFDELMKALISI